MCEEVRAAHRLHMGEKGCVDVSTARLSPAQRDLLANACFARRAVTLSVRQDLLTAPWHGNVVEQVHAESVVVDASAPAE